MLTSCTVQEWRVEAGRVKGKKNAGCRKNCRRAGQKIYYFRHSIVASCRGFEPEASDSRQDNYLPAYMVKCSRMTLLCGLSLTITWLECMLRLPDSKSDRQTSCHTASLACIWLKLSDKRRTVRPIQATILNGVPQRVAFAESA